MSTPGHNKKREAVAKHRANRDLAKLDREWHRETRARRRATKGADAELAIVAEQLQGRLSADWMPSASRIVYEVAGSVGGVSLRLTQRPGCKWRCSAWTKGIGEGLQVALSKHADPLVALDGALAQLDDLRQRLADVVDAVEQ
jgi:hypothetical protein